MSSDEDRQAAVDWRSEVLDALEGKLCVPDFTVRGIGVRKHSLEGGEAMGEEPVSSEDSTAVAVDGEGKLFIADYGEGAIEVRRTKRKLGDGRQLPEAQQRLRCGPVNSHSRVHESRRPVMCSNPWPVPTRRPRIC